MKKRYIKIALLLSCMTVLLGSCNNGGDVVNTFLKSVNRDCRGGENYIYISKAEYTSHVESDLKLNLEMCFTDESLLSGKLLKVSLLNKLNHKLCWEASYPIRETGSCVTSGSEKKCDIAVSLPMEGLVAKNEYFLAVSLLSDNTDNRIYQFYQDNYFKGGYTVIGIVGVGMSPGSTTLKDIVFDSLCDDSYTIYPDETVYPYNFTYNGNPLIRHHGAGDPDAHVWNDTVYVYCSQDNQRRFLDDGNYAVMDGYHVFSTVDMKNWTDHGEILHSRDVPWGLKGYMWAPCVAFKNGKYYLYYPHFDSSREWRIGVAISESPVGPFQHINKPIEGLNGIDPSVFIDEDGEAYIYCNPGVVAKLKPNMVELAETPRKIVYASDDIMECDTLQYNEGPYMHKYNGKYYFSYSNWHNKTNQAFYAVADNPYGPFEWKGAFAPHPKNAQDHHSIITFKGKHYYFYHVGGREFMPKDWQGERRILCFDEMEYNNDGSIKPIRHTSE